MTSPHYDILLTIRDIAELDAMTTDRLAMRRGVGERTIKSYISQARHLGADIKSFKSINGRYYWVLLNYPEIEKRLNRWIELEETGLKGE